MSSNLELKSRTRFSVEDLPAEDRWELWRDSVNCIFRVDADEETRSEDFQGSVDARLFTSLMVCNTSSRPQTWVRDNSLIAQDGMDHYMIQVYVNGSMVDTARKDAETVDAGKIIVYDLARPIETVTENFSNLNLVVPRHLLEPLLDDPDGHHMRVLSAQSGLPAIMKDTIFSLFQNMEQFPLNQSQQILDSVTSLAASTLNGQAPAGTTDIHQHKAMTTVAVKRFIQRNLDQPDLSPALICKEIGVSRSKLYGLFEQLGGVQAYIRGQRLRRAASWLTDPHKRALSIYDIALACGFSSDTTFIRAFKDAYEVTPGNLRRTASLSEGQEFVKRDPSKLDTRYEQWFSHLG